MEVPIGGILATHDVQEGWDFFSSTEAADESEQEDDCCREKEHVRRHFIRRCWKQLSVQMLVVHRPHTNCQHSQTGYLKIANKKHCN